jgi:hypothetical protein
MTEVLETPVSGSQIPELLNEDTEETLRSVRAKSGRSITASLLDIQKHASRHEKSLSWVSNLECLYNTDSVIGEFGRKRKRTAEVTCPTTKRLGRKNMSPSQFQEAAGSFIAVSYTWMAPVGQSTSEGAYNVETRIDGQYAPNKVRDTVLDRVIRYTASVDCQYFWIDQECIDQENEHEKEDAVQNMDLVYYYSKYPVALLSAKVQSDKELAILVCLLNGEFVDCTSPSLHPRLDTRQSAREALKLLYRITSDPWWNRAWPYQEDYLAGTRMELLIQCDLNLEITRRKNTELFGRLSGELKISSTNFRRELTRFCLAYKNTLDKFTCETILRRAAKYNVLQALSSELKGLKPMYPLIFRDVGSREIKHRSDGLAIVANCCDYPFRINVKKLHKTKASLSIAILALALLNGEVLVGTENKDPWSLNTSIFQFLDEHPLELHRISDRQLTFQKSCRLHSVKLTGEGICTTGRLWQLYKEIRITGSQLSSFKKDTGNGLKKHVLSQLKQLAKDLDSGKEGKQYKDLAQRLRRFIERDENPYDDQSSFAKDHMDLMAREVVNAMYSKTQILCLGRLVNGFFDSERSSYMGIFVVEAGHKSPSYVFTSSSPARDGPRQIPSHVSLLVSQSGTQASCPPKMIARQWISGLCLFWGSPTIKAVFSWPRSFMV